MKGRTLIDLANLLSVQLLAGVRKQLNPQDDVYLVGGYLRDYLAGRETHDLDYVMAGDPRPLARRVANHLGGSYYLMDESRLTARVVLRGLDGKSTTLDFARFRGDNLEDDLLGRDFTINAMALSAALPDQLIDPLHGADDLRGHQLRECSPNAFRDDPLRVMRAVRISLAYQLRIEQQTLKHMRPAAVELLRISMERRRDEFFRILEGSSPASAVRLLDHFGALQTLLPELNQLKGVSQSAPHVLDVWEHSLAAVDRMGEVLAALAPEYVPERAGNLSTGMLVLELGRFREAIGDRMAECLAGSRSIGSLLSLAALLHDIAKPETWSQAEGGRIRNLGHETTGEEVVYEIGRRLLLANEETAWLRLVVRNHMRIHQLARREQQPSRRAVYRFFKDCGPAGVEVILLTLADMLATYGPTLDFNAWKRQLETSRVLLEAWYEQPEESVRPATLLNGDDLQTEIGLPPGPLVGQLLDALQEARAAGELGGRPEALEFARRWVEQLRHKPNEEGGKRQNGD